MFLLYLWQKMNRKNPAASPYQVRFLKDIDVPSATATFCKLWLMLYAILTWDYYDIREYR
jgi:hypothetical protein